MVRASLGTWASVPQWNCLQCTHVYCRTMVPVLEDLRPLKCRGWSRSRGLDKLVFNLRSAGPAPLQVKTVFPESRFNHFSLAVFLDFQAQYTSGDWLSATKKHFAPGFQSSCHCLSPKILAKNPCSQLCDCCWQWPAGSPAKEKTPSCRFLWHVSGEYLQLNLMHHDQRQICLHNWMTRWKEPCLSDTVSLHAQLQCLR